MNISLPYAGRRPIITREDKGFSHLTANVPVHQISLNTGQVRDGSRMASKNLDITGPVSPFCLLTVQRKAKALLPSDELIITCDTIPAATTIIPRIAREMDLAVESRRLSTGHWEITLKRIL